MPPQFSALLGVELVRDMVCMYEQPTQQFHTVVALGSNVCGHRCGLEFPKAQISKLIPYERMSLDGSRS